MTSTARGTESRRLYRNSATAIATEPSAPARTMFHKSGRLANRHSPLYKPVHHRTSPWASTARPVSVMNQASGGGLGSML